jgi:hypothetical protein
LDASNGSGAVYVLDSITGGLLWSAAHEGEVDTSVPIAVTITENWLVYAFAEEGSHGHHTRIVSTELYEKKQKGDTFSSYDREKPFSISQSFIFPGRITFLATSQTLHGISTKALLGVFMAGIGWL